MTTTDGTPTDLVVMTPAQHLGLLADLERARQDAERARGLLREWTVDDDGGGCPPESIYARTRAFLGPPCGHPRHRDSRWCVDENCENTAWCDEKPVTHECDQCGAKRARWQRPEDSDCPRHADPTGSCDGVLVATPTPGPVSGRGLDPATVEACAKVIEGCGAILGKDAASRIRAQFPSCTCDGYTCAACVEWFKYRATGIRALTSPTDTKGRPDNGK